MISVIIPAYNEEKRIEKTIKAIKNELHNQNKEFEIVVVDDGSRDATKTIVSALLDEQVKLFSYEKNKGKGGAVKYGVEHALGDFIVFTDADLPYPPEKIVTACNLLNEADIILGKRVQSEEGGKYPWYRTVMSKGFGLFVRLVLGFFERDTQCGFKAFKKEAAKTVFEKVRLLGWGFDVEIIFLAQKMNLKVSRLCVELNHEEKGSKINIVKDTLKMMKEVFLIKSNDKKGLYD